MKTIFNDSDFAALEKRVQTLGPVAPRQWGKMDVGQMLAHVNRAIDLSMGNISAPSESTWLLRVLIKRWAVGSLPIMKSSPTSDTMRMTDPKDFQIEKQKLLENLRAAKARGLAGTWSPHVAFGPLTADEWGRLHHKHLDHHLRQFAA
ncbi:MAG TPA: DUF1569 domain-containing protein [bacterium]|jgi:hypothetical protein